jgi:hypothetical protein
LIVPADAFQITVLFGVLPDTVAVKGSVPFVMEVAGPGEITTEVTTPDVSPDGAPAVTFTEAQADLLGSATLVARMTWIPTLGAVYTPADVIVPRDECQVTALFVAPPTFAVKVTLPFIGKVAEAGDMLIELTASFAAIAVTLIEIKADLLGSATLVALMVWVPGLGAV